MASSRVRPLRCAPTCLASAVVATALLLAACGAEQDRAHGVAASQAALTTREVQLLRAQDAIVTAGGGALQQILVFDVAVKNLGYQKSVFVHLKDPCGGSTWSDFQGTFVQPAGTAGYELWRVKYSINTMGGRGPFTFAVGYTVNGTTYWDSNGGSNYVLPFVTGWDNGMQGGVYGLVLANGTHVLLASAQLVDGALSGYVHVPNLGYQKAIGVVYSTDGWVTQHTIPAAYFNGPNADGVETWSFFGLVGGATRAKLAISYAVNGTTSWDNNFGWDYTVTSSGADGAASPAGAAPTPALCR